MNFNLQDTEFDGFLPDNTESNHLSLIDSSKFHQFKLSLQRDSNITSQVLLEDVWKSNKKLFNSLSVEHILNSANSLVKKTDRSNINSWKNCISEIDTDNIMKKTLPNCTACSISNEFIGLNIFQNNECQCVLGITETLKEDSSSEKCLITEKNIPHTVRRETKDEQKVFKPRFVRARPTKIKIEATTSKTNQEFRTTENIDLTKFKTTDDIDITKEEEEDEKAHKSYVAKITFKTAKEQFLVSNPAARRTLGASRKVQGKFVSPMLGGIQEKQNLMETEMTDERLKHIDPKMIELIESEIIDRGAPIRWVDIAGLQLAKSVIQESVVWPLLRPDIFTGLRRPPKGILLFGPPGTGKTLIGKCVAAQCNATFFSISASSLTSKWIGDGEKMVRALFAVARCHQPAVIFIDEIDSLLTQRSDTEHEATRRIKTEFLVQFDGAAIGEEDRILIVGATNRPQELDEAARRRLVKRLYIPLPDLDARKQIIENLLSNENNDLTPFEVSEVANLTEGYSGADMKSLCSEAAMGPIRSVPLSQIVSVDRNKIRPVCLQDFNNALQRVKPSVSHDDLGLYEKWNKTYGQGF